MDDVFNDFRTAQQQGAGYLLATTISPEPPENDPFRLQNFARSTNHARIEVEVRRRTAHDHGLGFSRKEGEAWVEVFVAYWKACCELMAVEIRGGHGKPQEGQWSGVYDAWKDMVNALIRGYSSGVFASWTIPCLYVAGKYLRLFAIKADEGLARMDGGLNREAAFQDDVMGVLAKHEKLEDAARQINRIFSLCLNDRAPIEESRKWAVYYTTNLLFKTYFRLNAISLCKNILRSIQAANTDMPPLTAFPKSHIVTFNYYVGVIAFLEEDYLKAEEHLTQALRMCLRSATKNRELILTYLIPCRLLTKHTLPNQALLTPYARIRRLFTPLCACIKRGDLAGFDTAMTAGQDEFVRRRIYLTLERGRDIALRNLFRKVFLAARIDPATGERSTRIPVQDFAAAVKLRGEVLDRDEVECLLANMIYKSATIPEALLASGSSAATQHHFRHPSINLGYPIAPRNLMKGYISREYGKVVLSKGGSAFPGTGV